MPHIRWYTAPRFDPTTSLLFVGLLPLHTKPGADPMKKFADNYSLRILIGWIILKSQSERSKLAKRSCVRVNLIIGWGQCCSDWRSILIGKNLIYSSKIELQWFVSSFNFLKSGHCSDESFKSGSKSKNYILYTCLYFSIHSFHPKYC